MRVAERITLQVQRAGLYAPRVIRSAASANARYARSGILAGSVHAWLCTSATGEGRARGRACWAAGQIRESAHPGQRVSAEDRPTVTGPWLR